MRCAARPIRSPRRLRAAAAALAPLAIFALARPARAEPPRPASLAWTRSPGAEACPAGPAVAAEVERVLAGRPLVPLAQAEIVVEGSVSRAGDGFDTILTLVDREGAVLGTRRLHTAGPQCAAVRGEVGLVIALMIDPDAALRPGPSLPPVSPPPISPTPATPSALPAVAPPPVPGAPGAPSVSPAASSPAPPPACPPLAPSPPPRPFRAHLSVGPVLAFGLLPSVGVGARVRAAVTPPGLFPFEIGGDLFVPSRAEQANVGIEVFTASGRLRACPLAPSRRPWSLLACGGFELGALRGGGFGFPTNRGGELLTAAASLGGRVQVHIAGGFVASLGLDLSVPFRRARVTYGAPDGSRRELFVTAPVTGAADLGLGFEL